MEIVYNEKILKTVEDWHKYVYTGNKSRNWRPGYSAESLAQYICNNDGIKNIEKVISSILNEDVCIDSATPEKEIHFDKYGHGREHDLAITAKTATGKKVFIGIEAKVNEEFGDTICKKYLEGKTKELNGVNTNLCNRIESLMRTYLPNPINEEDFNLRYQLLHATAGTMAADDSYKQIFDYHIFLVLTFLTSNTDDAKVDSNYSDFNKYVKRLHVCAINDFKDTYSTKVADGNLILAYRKVHLE